jgi:hypothetical protein
MLLRKGDESGGWIAVEDIERAVKLIVEGAHCAD